MQSEIFYNITTHFVRSNIIKDFAFCMQICFTKQKATPESCSFVIRQQVPDGSMK